LLPSLITAIPVRSAARTRDDYILAPALDVSRVVIHSPCLDALLKKIDRGGPPDDLNHKRSKHRMQGVEA
jgi:hypothetical protein